MTTSAFGSHLLEWDGDGRYLRTVGRAGAGPGEFSARGGLLLFPGPADSLFLLDGGQRWSVFDPDLEYVRSFIGTSNGRQPSGVHLLPGRGILTTGLPGVGPVGGSVPFHLMDFEGSAGTELPTVEAVPAPGGLDEVRVSDLDGYGGIWLAPRSGAARGLELERWLLDGTRAATLRRAVPWLPPGGYDPAPGEPTLPEYELLHVDDHGLIWVVAIVRDLRWRALSAEQARLVQEELYDARIEVYNPANQKVVASYRLDGPSEELPPFSRFLGRDDLVYRTVEDSVGLRSVEVFRVSLVGR